MNKQELIDEYLKIKDVNKDIAIIYDLMDKLGIKYQKTACKRCRKDFQNLIAEELGLIKSAADNSGWDDEAEYEYLMGEDYSWQGHRLNADTPKWVIRRFFASEPVKAVQFYRAVQNKNTTDIQNEDKRSEIHTQD